MLRIVPLIAESAMNGAPVSFLVWAEGRMPRIPTRFIPVTGGKGFDAWFQVFMSLTKSRRKFDAGFTLSSLRGLFICVLFFMWRQHQ
jgi:hypothetical protein